MNQPKYPLAMLLALFAFVSTAQTLSPTVISTAGGLAHHAGGSVSYTIGEMAMVETFTGPTNFLTQGFQQPWELITAIPDDLVHGLQVGISPNPNDGHFYIRIGRDQPAAMEYTLTNVFGQTVLYNTFQHDSKSSMESVNASFLSSGIYFLSLRIADQGSASTSIATTKIHITR